MNKSSLPIVLFHEWNESAKLLFQIGGIGKVTEHILKDALGINTCEEMLQKGGHLCALFSISSAGQCAAISHRNYIMNSWMCWMFHILI